MPLFTAQTLRKLMWLELIDIIYLVRSGILLTGGTRESFYNRGSFGRKTLECDDSYILRESSAPYNCHLANKKGLLSTENSYYLPINTV
jgi:hypothetical protein